jgi:hypothetical protein
MFEEWKQLINVGSWGKKGGEQRKVVKSEKREMIGT